MGLNRNVRRMGGGCASPALFTLLLLALVIMCLFIFGAFNR